MPPAAVGMIVLLIVTILFRRQLKADAGRRNPTAGPAAPGPSRWSGRDGLCRP